MKAGLLSAFLAVLLLSTVACGPPLVRSSKARATVPWQGRKWSDLTESMEIESSGRLTTAKLYGEACTCWASFQVVGERPYVPLLLHE